MPNFANPSRRTAAQRLARSVPFRRDDQKEHLLQMREQRPAEFAALPPNVHIALGLYESDKATHEQITGDAA
jgi:hypothetical protein